MNWIEKQAHSSIKAGNRILLLRDTNGDGVPELRTVFLDHLQLALRRGAGRQRSLCRQHRCGDALSLSDGQTQITAPGIKLCDLPGGPIDHHWTKSLTASPDGTKLYAGVGSNSNITENGIGAEMDRAAIWEIDRATGAHRLFATGLRNPNGLQFEPQTHALWAVVNERDELGPDLVPDYMTSVKDGAFYGWPYSYYGQHVDPRVHAAAAGSGGQGDPARLRAQLAMSRRWAWCSTPATICRPLTAAAPLSASMAAGTAPNLMAKGGLRAVREWPAQRHGPGCGDRLPGRRHRPRPAGRPGGGQQGRPADRRRCRQHGLARHGRR